MTVSLVNTWISLTVEPKVLDAKRLLSDEELPMLSVVCPLYREPNVVKQLFDAVTTLKYPQDKIEFLWVLERDDAETIEAIQSSFKDVTYEGEYPIEIGDKIKILYNIKRRMKANSLNLALEKAVGEYLVVYDADVIPEGDQALKAMAVFADNPEYSLLQAFIKTYNKDENTLTGLYEDEFRRDWDYSTRLVNFTDGYFNLKGHSFFVKTDAARDIRGWNEIVTEDLDFGINLAISGYKMGIFRSITQEEGPSTLKQNLGSRTRVCKGFIKSGTSNARKLLECNIGKKKLLAITDIVLFKPIEKIILPLVVAAFIYSILFGTFIPKVIFTLFFLLSFSLSTINYYKITSSVQRTLLLIGWDLFTCVFMFTGLIGAIINPDEFTATGHNGRAKKADV